MILKWQAFSLQTTSVSLLIFLALQRLALLHLWWISSSVSTEKKVMYLNKKKMRSFIAFIHCFVHWPHWWLRTQCIFILLTFCEWILGTIWYFAYGSWWSAFLKFPKILKPTRWYTVYSKLSLQYTLPTQIYKPSLSWCEWSSFKTTQPKTFWKKKSKNPWRKHENNLYTRCLLVIIIIVYAAFIFNWKKIWIGSVIRILCLGANNSNSLSML